MKIAGEQEKEQNKKTGVDHIKNDIDWGVDQIGEMCLLFWLVS